MQLYFLRHGQADWPDWQQADDERPLTEPGKKEIRKVADFLKLLDLSLEKIVTSPLPRARQTAEIVADCFELKLREDPVLKPGFNQSGLKNLLHQHDGSSLMLVGHEPDFTRAIHRLTGASLKLSKGGFALVEADPALIKGRLLWLFPPRIVKASR